MAPDVNFINPQGTGPIIRLDMGAGTRATADFVNYQKNGSEVFSIDYQGLPDPGGNQATRQVVCPLGDIVADSDAIEDFLFEARAGITITAAYIVVDTATADGSTNRQTLTIKTDSDDTVATYQTDAANPGLAQATVTSMGSITNGTLAAGDYLYVTYTKTSSGLALSGATIILNYTMTS